MGELKHSYWKGVRVVPAAPLWRLYLRALIPYVLIAVGWAIPNWWISCAVLTVGFSLAVHNLVKTHSQAVLACDAIWIAGITAHEAKQAALAERASNN